MLSIAAALALIAADASLRLFFHAAPNRSGFLRQQDDFRARQTVSARLYYSPDAYLTPQGHAAAAQTLVKALAAQANL